MRGRPPVHVSEVRRIAHAAARLDELPDTIHRRHPQANLVWSEIAFVLHPIDRQRNSRYPRSSTRREKDHRRGDFFRRAQPAEGNATAYGLVPLRIALSDSIPCAAWELNRARRHAVDSDALRRQGMRQRLGVTD